MSTALNVASSPGPVHKLERGLVTLAKFLICAESAYYVHIKGIFASVTHHAVFLNFSVGSGDKATLNGTY